MRLCLYVMAVATVEGDLFTFNMATGDIYL